MIKTINLGNGQSMELNSSMGWIYNYQEQFGHDVLVVIMPAIEAGLNFLIELTKSAGGEVGGKDAYQLLSQLDQSTFTDAFITLSGMQLTTIVNISWAMAKNANDEIDTPKKWVNNFEVFPMDLIVKETIGAVLESSISKKNLKKIRKVMEGLRSQSPSSESQSQELTED